MGASPSIISSSWRRTKIPRFQSFEDAAAADEEAMLIHQLEMLEIQEEIDNEDDDEDLEILEEEEANDKEENNKEKKFQPQITSFFAKKK